jgi:hypothetical protein
LAVEHQRVAQAYVDWLIRHGVRRPDSLVTLYSERSAGTGKQPSGRPPTGSASWPPGAVWVAEPRPPATSEPCLLPP